MDTGIEEKLQILRVLDSNPEWIAILKEALEIEKAGVEKYRKYKEEQEAKGYNYEGTYLGWEWHEVHTAPQTLNKMVTAKVLDIAYSSRSSTHYRVRNPEIIEEALTTLAEPEEELLKPEIPGNLFESIVGHNNIKTIVKYAIDSEKPTHLLFQGVPSSAKTLFLLNLSQLPNSYYCLAQTVTGAGLADILFTTRPKFLLVDEIDRLSPDNIGVLNSLMATGVISESKIGKTRMMELNTKVFAAGIRIQKLPRDLLSRFITLRFKPYTESQFIEVCTSILPKESCDAEAARLIGSQIWQLYGSDSDIRKAVQVARLSNGDITKIREIIRVLKRQ